MAAASAWEREVDRAIKKEDKVASTGGLDIEEVGCTASDLGAALFPFGSVDQVTFWVSELDSDDWGC